MSGRGRDQVEAREKKVVVEALPEDEQREARGIGGAEVEGGCFSISSLLIGPRAHSFNLFFFFFFSEGENFPLCPSFFRENPLFAFFFF